MRTLKELYIILLDNIDNYVGDGRKNILQSWGLCGAINRMYLYSDIYTFEERITIENHLRAKDELYK